jgi:CMP-N-acetylneuraminic acid synthetase
MLKNKRILAMTLARGGSKRVKRKNLADICGKPLLQYTIDEVKKSRYIDEYVISSDDEEVIDLASKLGVKSYKRSIENSTDTSTSADAILETIQNQKFQFDIIVEVMCTNPLKTVEDIDGVINKLVETKSDSVVSVVRVWDHHPSRIKFIEKDTLIDVYPEIPESRRQDLSPPAYVRNGSIYAFDRTAFLNEKKRLCGICRPYVMPESRTINVDEEIDLELARILIGKRNEANLHNSD